MPQAAVLEFIVDGKPGDWSLTVRKGEPAEEVGRWDLDDREIDAVHEALPEALTHIHDLVKDDLEPSGDAPRTAVETLSTLAYRVTYGLFKGDSLDHVFRAAHAHAGAALNPVAPPRIVEVSTPIDFAYPFELLPWHHVGDDIQDPALRVRALLGMSAIVRRRLRRMKAGGAGPIENEPSLPITVFRHAGLTGTENESDYLTQAEDIVEVYGPWPRPGEQVAEQAIMRHLLDSRSSLDDAGRTSPAAVLHFACHCDTTSSKSDHHKIKLDDAEASVLLGQLKAFAAKPAAWGAPRPRPLVFLNACGSAVPHLASRVSFPEFFLDQDSLGVVGTLCDISNDVAAHFAAVFYEALLRKRTVGEAMYDARWHLMDRHRNPLGLLYTFYGNPDLRVTHSRAGRVIPACTLTRPAT